MADGRLAFAAAVGMVVRVHNRAAHGGSPAHMALSAGLTDLYVLMVNIADLADSGHAVYADIAQLAGRQAEKSHAVFLSHKLSHVAGCTSQLSALAGIQLHIVEEGTNRNIVQRQSIAGLDIRGFHRLPQHRRPSGRWER